MFAVAIVIIIPTTLKEEEKMRQAPSEDALSLFFMLKAGLTVSWIRIISSFAYKVRLLICYFALFFIRVKCYRTLFLFGFILYPFAGNPPPNQQSQY